MARQYTIQRNLKKKKQTYVNNTMEMQGSVGMDTHPPDISGVIHRWRNCYGLNFQYLAEVTIIAEVRWSVFIDWKYLTPI